MAISSYVMMISESLNSDEIRRYYEFGNNKPAYNINLGILIILHYVSNYFTEVSNGSD